MLLSVRNLDVCYGVISALQDGGIDVAGLANNHALDYGRETLTGTPEMCLERLAAFASNGVEEMIVSASSLPFAIQDWSMVELIAGALIPQAATL